MAGRKPDKRSRLICAALKLFREQGYTGASLAEIATDACLQPGNVYYYFKTKDELGEAVVQHLFAMSRARRDLWDAREHSPRARVSAFIQMHLDVGQELVRCGCAVGELGTAFRRSHNKPMAEQAASVYWDIQGWLQEQFELLGHCSEAQDLAAHLLCAIQGAIQVSQVFNDLAYLERRLSYLQGWLRGL